MPALVLFAATGEVDKLFYLAPNVPPHTDSFQRRRCQIFIVLATPEALIWPDQKLAIFLIESS